MSRTRACHQLGRRAMGQLARSTTYSRGQLPKLRRSLCPARQRAPTARVARAPPGPGGNLLAYLPRRPRHPQGQREGDRRRAIAQVRGDATRCDRHDRAAGQAAKAPQEQRERHWRPHEHARAPLLSRAATVPDDLQCARPARRRLAARAATWPDRINRGIVFCPRLDVEIAMNELVFTQFVTPFEPQGGGGSSEIPRRFFVPAL